jgi:mobilome CxxCx(11)CxxC protein
MLSRRRVEVPGDGLGLARVAGTLAPVTGGEGDDERLSQLRSEAWDRAVHAAGTAAIFERRARVLRNRLALLTYAGFAFPIAVGLLVLSYGLEASFLPIVIPIAVALAALQLLVALWSTVKDWPGSLERAIRSHLANEASAQRFQDLGKTPPPTLTEMRHAFVVVAAGDDVQRQQDHALGMTNKELRMGMRAALFRYRRSCASCKLVPSSTKPTRCEVCGDF